MRNHTTHFSGCDCVTHKIEKLEAENARLREAFEWMVNNQSLIIFAENENHVSHFMSKAREALKGGE
jgi:hypothetical protein